MAKICSECGKEVKFLKGEYYTPPKGKQIFLCSECLKKIKEGTITLKELNEDIDYDRRALSFVIILLVSFFNIVLFLILFTESARRPGASEGVLLTGMMLCGSLFLLWVIFAIVLAIFITKMRKEYLRAIMYLDIILLVLLSIGVIIVKYL